MQIEQKKIEQVVIEFQVIDGDYSFQDHIEYTADEFKGINKKDIDATIDVRYQAWKKHMTDPIPEETKDNKEKRLVETQRQIQELSAIEQKLIGEISTK